MRRRAIGHSLHVGLDVVNGLRYGVRARPLQRAGLDMIELAAIAESRGFSSETLRDQDATTNRVVAAIGDAARSLRPGDTFALTFSGHGLAVDTHRGFQQSWCLFDGGLVRFGDAGLDAALARFRAGVRIMIIANCCFAAPSTADPVLTPRIAANVIRIASCRTHEIALDRSEEPGPSPFIRSFKSALGACGNQEGFFSFYDRLVASRHPAMRPHIEIGRPRSEAFLAAGPFKLP